MRIPALSVCSCNILDRKLGKLNPTFDQLCLMEMFLEVLKPLSSLTDAMSTEQSVSVAKLYPLLLHIKKLCTTDVQLKDYVSPEPEVLQMARAIQENIWIYIRDR